MNTPKGWKRFLIVPDTHGQFVHEGHLAKCLEHKDDFKPHLTIHLGDFIDATCLRSGAGDADQSTSFSEDWICAKRMLEALRPDIVMMGNHEVRLWKTARSPSTIISEFAETIIKDITGFIQKGLKATWFPYNPSTGVYRLTPTLKILHGYHANKHACHTHAQIFGNCIIGHIHSIESSTAVRDDVAGATCYSAGWLGDVKYMDYIAEKTGQFKWANGWGYGFYSEKTGAWNYHQAQIIENKVML